MLTAGMNCGFLHGACKLAGEASAGPAENKLLKRNARAKKKAELSLSKYEVVLEQRQHHAALVTSLHAGSGGRN
jgi:hypothetical protein